MLNIKFINSESVQQADVKKIASNLIEIAGVAQNISGFYILDALGNIRGKYEDYTTLYRELDNSFILSNDESVYVEPEPLPDPEPYEPTLEEIQESKVLEMELMKQQVVNSGIDVELLDGTTKHFPLDNDSLLYMMGLKAMVDEGSEQIPWHTDDENEPCEFYSNANMKKIMSEAMAFITWNETWIKDLVRYIRSLTNKEDVQAITYSTEIPVEYQSEVLQTMIAAQSE